jgi:hypothetical protein
VRSHRLEVHGDLGHAVLNLRVVDHRPCHRDWAGR